MNRSARRPELERGIGWLGAGAILAGTVIGTGIFLVPSTIARETGAVWAVFLVWAVGGLLSLAGALSYAELGAAFSEAGGEYVFLRRAYGPLWGFLFGWQQVVIGKTGAIAGIATAFAIFLGYFVHDLDQSVWRSSVAGLDLTLTGVQLTALASILVFSLLNYGGVVLGSEVQIVLTLLKVGAIVALAALGLVCGEGEWEHFSGAAAASAPIGIESFGAALAAALWAYDGWNNVTMIGAEIRHPQRTIPRVLIFGIISVMAVYLLINLAYFYVLPFAEVRQSERLAQDMASAALGEWGGRAITVAAIVSTLAALNGAILSGARVSYAMARDGLFFRHMGDIDPVHRTPAKALIVQGLAAGGLILVLGRDEQAFERLFSYAIFGAWTFYGITALAVIVLRHRQPALPRPYRTLGYPWVPLAFFLVACAFCTGMVMQRPRETGLGLALLAGGLPFYAYWRFRMKSGSGGGIE
ncbi:amino acid permease [Methylocaldum marinum]|uniref:Amino acid permease n=1 Tax=Methylocaldum marinum TaxID=1432792 RepID=A0A250KQN7_9GAMM|nr:amino acid permease [Methylocaldum marinum]BBA33864.1 amino acid permease [Methylocaldum marinum]